MKILFSGGGTLGPVTPLLAMCEVFRKQHPGVEVVWVGTHTGPERLLVSQYAIPFFSIPAGKLRRYISVVTVFDIFRLVAGCVASLQLLWKEKPDVCISAGGFVSVPVHVMAWIMGIPTWVHQQDVIVGLANRLMSPFAIQITTALEKHVASFPKRKTLWLGNPVRSDILAGNKRRARTRFGLSYGLPVVFVTGGGTGSLRVNQLITEAIPHLEGVCQVIHLSGKDRPQELVERAVKHFSYYHMYQFFTDEMKDAYAIADIVISRGGFGTITEIAALQKPAVLIPKPGHQIDNVSFLADQQAVVLLDERTNSGLSLAKIIKELLSNASEKKRLSRALSQVLPLAPSHTISDVLDTLLSK